MSNKNHTGWLTKPVALVSGCSIALIFCLVGSTCGIFTGFVIESLRPTETWSNANAAVTQIVITEIVGNGSNEPLPTYTQYPTFTAQPSCEAIVVTQTPQPTSASAEHTVGETVVLEDHTIVIEKAEFVNNVLKASFVVQNTSQDAQTVSSLLNFEARNSNSEKLDMAIVDCDLPSLSGTIPIGDSLRGGICWNIAGAGPYKIHYQPNPFKSEVIVWIVNAP